MKNEIKRLTRSPFVKNVAIMASGAAGAQVVAVALSPVITRLYGPEAFGILGTFTALTAVLTPISALTYPLAIVLPKNDNNAKRLIKLSLYITLITSVLTVIILLLFKNNIVETLKIKEIAPYLYLIPLFIIFSGFMQVTDQWLIRTNQFSINAKANFAKSIMINGGKAGIGVIYPSAVVLIVLQTVGNGIKALLNVVFAKKNRYIEQNDSLDRKLTIKELAKQHNDFPLYRAPEQFIGAITQNLPILLLTSLFGPAAAGFYNIGRTVLYMPVNLIGKSIGDVFYPRIARATESEENISKLIIKATLGLGAIGAIPFGAVIIFGPQLFEFVFGTDWTAAGEYARWIALSSIFVLMNQPSVRSMPVLNAQRLHLIFTSLKLIFRSSGLIIGFVIFNSDIVAVALFGIINAFLNVVLILTIIYISVKRYPNRR